MSDQTPSDAAIAAAVAAIAGSGGSAGEQNPIMPTPLGVPKYQLTPSGEVQYQTDESGKQILDANGKPIPVPWEVANAPGAQLPSPEGATSRVEIAHPTTRARYYPGDERTIVGGMTADQVYQLQRMLIDAGLMKGDKAVGGNWTNTEASAFSEVLKQANASGNTWDSTLAQMATNGAQARAATTAQAKPITVAVSKANKFAVASVADATAQRMWGRKMSDQERSDFLNWWDDIENRQNAAKIQDSAEVQQAKADLATGTVYPSAPGTPAVGQDVTSLPDQAPSTAPTAGQVIVKNTDTPLTPEEAAQQYAQGKPQFQAHEVGNQFQNFLSILQSSGVGPVRG